MATEVRCRGCGRAMGTDVPEPEHCRECPPTPCDECGGVNVWTEGALCACWTSLEGMNVAELKAVFASDCGPECGPEFSIDPRSS